MGSKLIISAAVGITPFTGSDGKPMSDVSAFADSLDWIGMPFRGFIRFISNHYHSTHGLRCLGLVV